jgi:hypothetical protein
MLRFAMLLALGTLPLGTLYAQATTPLTPGSQVRIRRVDHGRAWQKGVVRSMDDSSIVITSSKSGDLRVPLASVLELDVNAGGRSRMKGAGVGLLVGAGVGAVVGYTAEDDCDSEAVFVAVCFSRGETAMMLGALGGLAGMGVGALVGVGGRWRSVAIPSRVSISPIGAKGLRVAVAF